MRLRKRVHKGKNGCYEVVVEPEEIGKRKSRRGRRENHRMRKAIIRQRKSAGKS